MTHFNCFLIFVVYYLFLKVKSIKTLTALKNSMLNAKNSNKYFLSFALLPATVLQETVNLPSSFCRVRTYLLHSVDHR